jgi:hypothetical protein
MTQPTNAVAEPALKALWVKGEFIMNGKVKI